MRKKISVIVCIILTFIFVAIPNVSVRAESLTVTGVPNQIEIGKTFTVTIAVPENIGGYVFVEYSKDTLKVKDCPGSDVGTGSTSYTVFFESKPETITFEAVAAGNAYVNVYMSEAEYSDVDPSVSLPSIPKISKTLSVANVVAEQPDNNGETTEPQKSSDNSLATLKLSSGTLSPSFKYNVTKYTATVGYDVTKVVVSAKTSNEKATIESVTGDGTVNLKVGDNVIEIIVKAENGVKAKYTIVVTRKAQETVEPQPSEDESQSDTNTPEVNEFLQYNGEQLTHVAEIPAERIPAGFESKLLVVNGQQMQGLSFAKADLKVLYLNNTNGAGSLYVYDEAQQAIYPFIKLTSEQSYVMVLLPDEQNDPAPEGFESCTFSIEGKGTIKAYRLSENLPAGTEEVEDETTSWDPFAPETFYAAPANASEFYLIYCMNNEGEKGWYMYDAVEETFMRYFAMTPSVPVGGEVSDDTDLQDKYAALEKELNAAKMTQYIIIAVAAAIILILVVVIVVLVVKNRRPEEDFFDEYEDEDEEEIDDEETDVEEVIESELNEADDIVVDTMTEEVSEEDDEVEIEFYNMEELIVSETEETEKEVSETPVVEEAAVEEETPVVKEIPAVKEIKIERRPKAADPTSKLSSKKEDDDDLEFIDFE